MKRRVCTVLALFAVAGCSFSTSVGGNAVSADDLEAEIAKQSTDQGFEPESVECTQGLDAEVGATRSCTVYANDLKYTATVTATSVEGSSVNFDVEIPPPAIVPVETLIDQGKSLLEPQLGQPITGFECDDELVGESGETTECQVQTEDGQQMSFVVTVTDGNFLGVDFRFDPK